MPVSCFDLSRHIEEFEALVTERENSDGHFVLFTRRMCGLATPIIDMKTYPFMDLNVATGIDKLQCDFRSNLSVALRHSHQLHSPQVRWSAHAVTNSEPVFDFIVSGIRDIGFTVNNWLNVVCVIV